MEAQSKMKSVSLKEPSRFKSSCLKGRGPVLLQVRNPLAVGVARAQSVLNFIIFQFQHRAGSFRYPALEVKARPGVAPPPR